VASLSHTGQSLPRRTALSCIGATFPRPPDSQIIPGSGEMLIESRAGLRRMKARQESVGWNERMRQ